MDLQIEDLKNRLLTTYEEWLDPHKTMEGQTKETEYVSSLAACEFVSDLLVAILFVNDKKEFAKRSQRMREVMHDRMSRVYEMYLYMLKKSEKIK